MRRPLTTVLAFALGACSEIRAPVDPSQNGGYVGAATCGECHEERWSGFRLTSHHLASQLPSRESIAGSFEPPANVLTTTNSRLSFDMEARGDAFFETARSGGGPEAASRTERIDLVMGSGKLGQSYLSWRGSQYFQLPVSYHRPAGGWVNSPGDLFRDGTANFERPMLPRCLECHVTWMRTDEGGPASRDGIDRLVMGISCERCHGPGAEHVVWHRGHPDSKEPHGITNPADLSRERSNDLCNQCHGGTGRLLRDAFTYRPGDVLKDYVHVPPPPPGSAHGLHSANQMAEMRESRCFTESPNLTCASCHDPHALERGDLQRYSMRCVKCHEPASCGLEPTIGPSITKDCVSCHMERREMDSTVFHTRAGQLHPQMYDHNVRVLREASERFLAGRKTSK